MMWSIKDKFFTNSIEIYFSQKNTFLKNFDYWYENLVNFNNN